MTKYTVCFTELVKGSKIIILEANGTTFTAIVDLRGRLGVVTFLGGGDQGFCGKSTKTSVIRSVTMGGRG
jgi:hypothetical protein